MNGLPARIRTRQQAASVAAFAAGALLLVLLLSIGGVIHNPLGSGTPAAFGATNPAAGNDNNTNPVFQTVQNWRDLVKAVNSQGAEWYKQCLQDRTGVTWDQAQAYATLVDKGYDLRFILVSNANVSDDQAKQMLKDKGLTNVDHLPVQRVNGFSNTQGLPEDKCQPFGDARSQVRVALAIPLDVNNPSQGIHGDKGVLSMCSNPFVLTPVVPQQPQQPASPTAPTTPPGPTPTTRPGTPTTQPPPTTAPPTTAPPTTAPPTTVPQCESGKCTPPNIVPPPATTLPLPSGGGDSTPPSQGQSGTGAPPAGVTPPPTIAPPATEPVPTTAPPTQRVDY